MIGTSEIEQFDGSNPHEFVNILWRFIFCPEVSFFWRVNLNESKKGEYKGCERRYKK
ncbi:hypothetical protein GCM10007877_04280 [Marinibactrum halimedae]|uniref:Uncharacterized protein n=1 Tax=Marinibactrum halimedae TaxID=1444977 RepID=A0AA37T286_9GAMM|nr:hypothetical protein GCM10007877_04280 [Marinibactrum halimedae]